MAVRLQRPGFILSQFFHRLLLPAGCHVTSTVPWPSAFTTRQLYTPAALGLEQQLKTRQETQVRFANTLELFKERMRGVVSKQEGVMIFTEDLKNMIHLTQEDAEDLRLVREMARRFNKQNEGLRFGMYVFGPVLMRTYHILNQPQEALEALQDPLLSGFFEQLVTYQVCMDLLYEAKLYPEVLNVFGMVQGSRIAGVKYPKACINLAIAACYKMGTPDSLSQLQSIMDKTQEYGFQFNRRLLVFSAALALRTGNPHTGLNLMQQSTGVTHITVRTIKVMCLCRLGRLEEALLCLRAITEIDLPGRQRNKNQYILREAVSEVEATVSQSGSKEQQLECSRIVKFLEEAAAISEKTLDELVCDPIDRMEKRPNKNKALLAASFTNTDSDNRPFLPRSQRGNRQILPPRRQGLMDME